MLTLLRTASIAAAALAVAAMPSADAQDTGYVGTKYNVISPVLTGSNGNTSFLRFPNPGAATAKYEVLFLGSPTASEYGMITVTVPPGGSPQFSAAELFQACGVTCNSLLEWDNLWAFYIKNDQPLAGLQHVLFNGNSGSFENNSDCFLRPGVDYSSFNRFLPNVHTTRLAEYPSTITLHNFNETTVAANIIIRDARTGAIKGTTTENLIPNATYAFAFQHFQEKIGWVPTANEAHATMEFTVPSGTPWFVQLSHSVLNSRTGTVVNMTHFCPVGN